MLFLEMNQLQGGDGKSASSQLIVDYFPLKECPQMLYSILIQCAQFPTSDFFFPAVYSMTYKYLQASSKSKN